MRNGLVLETRIHSTELMLIQYLIVKEKLNYINTWNSCDKVIINSYGGRTIVEDTQ